MLQYSYWNCTILSGKCVPFSDSSGQSKLNTERCTHLYRIACIHNNNTKKLYLDIFFVRDTRNR
jgi:hypothetical protein